MTRFLSFFLLITGFAGTAANLIQNGDFKAGIAGWWSTPAKSKMVKAAKGELEIAPDNINLGVNSRRLQIGSDLKKDGTYKVSFRIKPVSIDAGDFVPSLTFYGVNGKYVKQVYFSRFKAGYAKSEWHYMKKAFGRGTAVEIPANAASMVVRFSFWDKSGKCRGKVLVDDVSLMPVQPGRQLEQPSVTSAGVIPARAEQLNGYEYYWIEAEDMVPEDADHGVYKYQRAWTHRHSGLPNDSMLKSLVRPIEKNIATANASVKIKPGKYNLFLRIGTFRPWKDEAVTVTVNRQKFVVAPKAVDPILNNAWSWVKVNSEPLLLEKARLDLTVSNDIVPQNQTALDCFLLTSDLKYVPAKKFPRCQYYSVLPYKGPAVEADIWHPRQLDIPVYICQGSSQQFLMRLRNYTDRDQQDFSVVITVPKGISLANPVRSRSWRGDNDKWKKPHFIHGLPDRFIAEKGKEYNRFELIYDSPVKPYDVYEKISPLNFIVLKAADSIKPGKYQVKLQVVDKTKKWHGADVTQELVVLPRLQGRYSKRYDWGIDAIYASFLNPVDQENILKSFEDAGITVWASRVRERNRSLAARNKEYWQVVRKHKRLKLANWGEWWWPGTPYNDNSLNYVKKHPEALGVWRMDDRGRTLVNKLICPEYLIQNKQSTYLREHLTGLCKLLKDNDITEFIEDVEYSSPLSYCFCPRCKAAFKKFSGIDVGSLDGDRIIKKYKNQWIAFRCRQNTQLVDKITRIAHELYPEIKFKLFCGYQSYHNRQRYGVDWEQLLRLPKVDGVYVGGGGAGTADQIAEMQEWAHTDGKEFISMANATLSFPHGYDEMSLRDPAYLEARIIHDIMCGSGGIFIWWWGTLDGRCLKAFETGSRIAVEYGDILLDGKHSRLKVGKTRDFYLLTAENRRGKLISLSNPSRFTSDLVLEPDAVIRQFPADAKIIDLLKGRETNMQTIAKRLARPYKKGDVSLWYIKK